MINARGYARHVLILLLPGCPHLSFNCCFEAKGNIVFFFFRFWKIVRKQIQLQSKNVLTYKYFRWNIL